MSECPTRTSLERFLAGQFGEADETALCMHVEDCSTCQTVLDELVQPNTLGANSWPIPPEDNGVAGELNFQTWIAKWKVARRAKEPAKAAVERTQLERTAGEAAFDFLGAPRNAGNLGRLGHYEIIELVGRGGMGVVFKAFDEKLHRVVAIKVLSPELTASGTFRQRFIREAQAAAAVTHEHVIAIHAVEDDGPVPYLVMQFVEGISLEQRLKQAGALELKEILRIGLQIAQGLAAAHKQGLVHRDVKPANILLENGIQRVKITDFGLARAVDDASLTQSGVVAGTPMFMSPEQASGEPIDQRSDLFSLGSVLYMLCTGHPPFRANASMAVLKRVCEETPRPIRESNPDIPDWMEAIIAKLHGKKPSQRYASAGEVARLLEDRLAQLQQPGYRAPAMPIREAAAAGAPRRRRRARLAAAASVILLAATFAGYHLFTSNQVDDPVDQVGNGSLKLIVPVASDTKHARAEQDDWAKRLGVPVEIVNSVGMKLRLIPPGELKIRDVGPKTGNIHAKPLYAGIHEVTVGQFRHFVKDTGYQTDAEKVLQGGLYFAEPHGPALQRAENIWSHADFAGAEDWPVSMVTWHDARAFCDWLSGREGRSYRLPTESEWYWCAWGNSGDRYYFGDKLSAMTEHAWHLDNSEHKVHPVGGKQVNPWGLFDIYGNVNELCFDWYRDGKRVTTAAFPEGPGQGASIPVRGASFHDESKSTRNPGQVPTTWASSHIGFRVILEDVTPQDGPLRAVAPFDAEKAREHQDAWAKHLGVPVETANWLHMKMRLIPPGSWSMSPGYQVRLTKPFRIAAHEVTVAQFRAFVEKTGHKTDAERNGEGGIMVIDGQQVRKPEFTWQHKDVAERDDQPVGQLSWNDAVKFVEWLSKDGVVYRLPTEAEWEWACRGGAMTRFYFGDDPSKLDGYAWYKVNADNRPHPVGLKKPNAWGLFDLYGNVAEYCQDWNVEYPRGLRTDPKGPVQGTSRVLRGLGFFDRAESISSSSRAAAAPTGSMVHFGFRVVCETIAVEKQDAAP